MKKKQGRRFTIGLLGCLFLEDYNYQVSDGVVEAVKEYDINLLCFDGGSLHSPRYFGAQKNVIYDLVHESNMDGIIAISGSIGLHISRKELKNFFLRFAPLPIVSIGVILKGELSITVDNKKGMRELLTHFIEVHGSRRIAFISGPENNSDALQRLSIYKEVLDEYNLPFDPRLVTEGDFTKVSGKEAIGVLLDKRHIQFDTIIGANDNMAICAMNELIQRGIRVPGDVRVGGFDNAHISYGVLPSLTTVEQPMFELGYRAVESLFAILTGEKKPGHCILPSTLVVRRSCGCIGPFDVRESVPEVSSHNDQEIVNHNIPTKKKLTDVLMHEMGDLHMRISRGKWIENLVDALMYWIDDESDNYDRSENDFLMTLEAVFLEAVEKGTRISEIYRIITTLFATTRMYCGRNRNLLVRLDALIDKITFSIGPITERIFLYMMRKAKEKDITYKKTSLWLISTKGIQELRQYLINEFLQLGVKTFYICMYTRNDNGRKQAYLLISHSDNHDCAIDTSGSLFPSHKLIPGGLRSCKKRFSLTVFPLFFQKEQFGFFLCDIESMDVIAQETLAGEVSSILKGAEYIEEIRSYSSDLEEKIKKRTIELELAKEKLEDANEQKTRFFINLAHDTKNPLTLIKNYLEKYILKVGLDNDLRIIKRNVDMLVNNMANYLDAEKLRRGQIIYNHNQIIDAADLVNNRIILFREIAKNKNIEIAKRIDKDIFIKADPYAFDRIVNNIIDNAIKYTNPKGKIIVSLKKDKNRVILNVRDNGIGMNKEKLSTLFFPSYQLSHKKESGQGMGMGLSIVKQIVESMNAEIRIKSSVGKGTSVSMIAQSHILSETEKTTQNISYSLPVEGKGSGIIDIEDGKINPEKNNIFIVDDNIELLFFLKSSLEEQYNVFLARSVQEAHKKLKTIPLPDIIISDVIMDEIDGHEFFLVLQKNEEYNNIPFIFLTAKNTIDEKIRGLTEGAIDYIYKPFVIDELKLKIRSIIQSRMQQTKKNIRMLEKRIIDSLELMYDDKKYGKEYLYFDHICEEHHITNREREVLRLLLRGLLNKEIGYSLQISERTVHTHIYNIYKKLNVQTRIELMNKFTQFA